MALLLRFNVCFSYAPIWFLSDVCDVCMFVSMVILWRANVVSHVWFMFLLYCDYYFMLFLWRFYGAYVSFLCCPFHFLFIKILCCSYYDSIFVYVCFVCVSILFLRCFYDVSILLLLFIDWILLWHSYVAPILIFYVFLLRVFFNVNFACILFIDRSSCVSFMFLKYFYDVSIMPLFCVDQQPVFSYYVYTVFLFCFYVVYIMFFE